MNKFILISCGRSMCLGYGEKLNTEHMQSIRDKVASNGNYCIFFFLQVSHIESTKNKSRTMTRRGN